MSNINKYNDNFVMYVPKIIHDNWKINDKGKVLLILDKHNIITKFSSWMLNKDINKDIEFDELSTSAWLNIDGERSILEIALLQKYNTDDSFDDALTRLVYFMNYIYKNKWIAYKKIKNMDNIDIINIIDKI